MFFLCAHNHVKLQKWRHRKTQRLRRQSASGETLMLMRVVVSAAEGERKHLYSCLVLLHLSFLIFCEGFGFGAPQGPPPQLETGRVLPDRCLLSLVSGFFCLPAALLPDFQSLTTSHLSFHITASNS